MEKEQRGEAWFRVPEVAQILGTGKQAVYDAVRDGRLKAHGEGWERRIHGEDVLSYAIRTGRDPKTVVGRIQKRRDVSLGEILGWALVGIGLGWLLAELVRERRGTGT